MTDPKVVRIVRDANGNETKTFDNSLNNEEMSLVNSKSKSEMPISPERDAWDLTIGKDIYISETERNTTLQSDKIAEKNYKVPIIKFNGISLVPGQTIKDFEGSSNYYFGEGYLKNGGQLGDAMLNSLKLLSTGLKNSENVQSITVNLNQAANHKKNSAEYNYIQIYGEAAVNNIINFLQKMLKGTNIKVNIGEVNTTPETTTPELKKDNGNPGVNIKIN